MKLEKKIESLIEDKGLIRRGETVLCGLSGGADSTALCVLLTEIGKAMGFSVAAAHVNHGIRGAEADRDEAFAKKLAEKLGIAFYSVRLDIPAMAKAKGESAELCARNERYAFFERIAMETGAKYVATAHNAGDNLETAVYNLARGTGIRGLAGIGLARNCGNYTLIRPLLYAERREIEEYLTGIGQDWVTDSTNLSDDYTRNRIRHNIVPELEKINPSALKTFESTSALLSAQADFIAREGEKVLREISDGEGVSAEALMALHEALRGEVVLGLYRRVAGEGAALTLANVGDVLALCESEYGSARVNLPCGTEAVREYGRLIIRKAREQSVPERTELRTGETLVFGKFAVTLQKSEGMPKEYKSVHNFFIDSSKIYGKLFIRARRQGDQIRLAGHAHGASLKKLMIDRRIPQGVRGLVPVFEDDNGIFAAALLGIDERVKVDESTREILEIKINEI